MVRAPYLPTVPADKLRPTRGGYRLKLKKIRIEAEEEPADGLAQSPLRGLSDLSSSGDFPKSHPSVETSRPGPRSARCSRRLFEKKQGDPAER